jgi:lipopolysaccharide transport system ATP-binding protein
MTANILLTENQTALTPDTKSSLPGEATDVAISVRQVSKMYPLYATPRDRLKQSLWYVLPKFLRRQPREFYQEFWALRNLSFEIKKGETVGVIGRNGSGKSTLLQLIAGTLTPTIGEVRVTGRVAALLELGSGFNPEFTGRENVYLICSILWLT